MTSWTWNSSAVLKLAEAGGDTFIPKYNKRVMSGGDKPRKIKATQQFYKQWSPLLV